jgi:gamma-D-glutamyl-L-lysine dipeptidyl-peptidase
LNIPYLWGGKNPFGMDCSGLTQTVFRLFGRKIPRDARQQAKLGHTVNFVDEAGIGDVAFFDNEEGEITHTVIVMVVAYLYFRDMVGRKPGDNKPELH